MASRKLWLSEKKGFPEFDFPGILTSLGIWIPRKCGFPGNVNSWEIWIPEEMWIPGKCEMWLPRKYDFLGNLVSQKLTPPWKCDFPGNVTLENFQGILISQVMWLPGKYDLLVIMTSGESWLSRKCDFTGIKISREVWLPRNVNSLQVWLTRKCDFPEIVTSMGKVTSIVFWRGQWTFNTSSRYPFISLSKVPLQTIMIWPCLQLRRRSSRWFPSCF